MLNNLLKLWHAISVWWDAFTTWLHALIGDTAWLMLVSTCETLYMTLTATAFATLLGVPLGVILYATRRGRFLANPLVYYPLGIVVNIGRSIPYLILALWIIPFTRAIVGVSIGNTAAIVPLTLSAALLGLMPALVAALAGATLLQAVWGFAAFQSAKSIGCSFVSLTSTRAPASISSRLRPLRQP